MNAATLIRALRQKVGLTRTEMAQKAGIAYALLWNWEKGNNCPTLDSFVKLVRAVDYEIVLKPKYRKESE